eukprot:TRINITY_DN50762_c0_g1_i1.p1 TRINITY_DN50762_c0_g1~~TRINITY_DN50762_c0_g1_i1.p1  ORF type:complete len:603 (+),score=159.32 TRINITY_DN50762_c0_g1_i1:152-1960(+)
MKGGGGKRGDDRRRRGGHSKRNDNQGHGQGQGHRGGPHHPGMQMSPQQHHAMAQHAIAQQQWNAQMQQMQGMQWSPEMARQQQQQFQSLTGQHVGFHQHGFSGEAHSSVPPAPPGGMYGAGYSYRGQKAKIASGREIESYFIPEPLRLELVRRGHMLYHCLPQELDPLEGIQVDRYVNLLELDALNRRVVDPTKVYQGLTGRVFRCVDSTNGQVYALRKLEAFQPSGKLELGPLERWKQVRHPNIVGLHQAFTSKSLEESSALYFAYSYHPNAVSLEQRIIEGQTRPSEASIWSIICQLVCALRHLHLENLVCRVLSPSKILIQGRNRVRINCVGTLDVISPAEREFGALCQEDLVALGRLVMQLCCRDLAAASRENMGRSMEYIEREYSSELKQLVWQLLSSGGKQISIMDVATLISGHMFSELEANHTAYDELEGETSAEIENGRIARVLIKLSFVCQHPLFGQFESSEAPYLLKLTWDYIFHQMDEDDKPVVEYAHVVECLNKLDIGVEEQVMLVSSDAADLLCVSWRDLKDCLDKAAADLLSASSDSRNAFVEQPVEQQPDYLQQMQLHMQQMHMQEMGGMGGEMPPDMQQAEWHGDY